MSIVKLNNRAVKDATAVGSITGLGNLVFISRSTASSSSSVNITSGINSTYKEYIFFFNNIHPATNNVYWSVNFSTDGGSNYNVTKTTTNFSTTHAENDVGGSVAYEDAFDLAQSTNVQWLVSGGGIGNGNDESLSGIMHLFDPSNTTFVKHFISTCQWYHNGDYSSGTFVGGYCNTTSAIDAVQFTMHSGNIDAGTITMYGVN